MTINNAVMNQSPGYIIWRNSQYQYLGCNKTAANFHGLSYPEDIIGLTNYDLPYLEGCSEEFEAMDNLAMIKTTVLKSICFIKNQRDDYMPFYNVLSPLLNHANEVEGVVCHSLELDINLLNGVGSYILRTHLHNRKNKYKNKNYMLGTNFKKEKLSPREQECLFYLIHGKTAKGISTILGISPKTVESHIEKIKIKFNCLSKSQLIEKAISFGYLNVIPETLFN